MTNTPVLLTQSDVAQALGVTSPKLAGWRKNHDDTPPPDFTTPSGILLWRASDDWERWRDRFANAEFTQAKKDLEQAQRRYQAAKDRLADAARRNPRREAENNDR